MLITCDVLQLCDNYACLCYCAEALKRDPYNKKAIEYKSKVYQEMPFMQVTGSGYRVTNQKIES